jgi:hypothetical protein
LLLFWGFAGFVFFSNASFVPGGGADDGGGSSSAPSRDCPNPYNPLTGEFEGFSDYPIALGPTQTVDFPAKLDRDGFAGPDEFVLPDGTEVEPETSVTGQGEAVYRCAGNGSFSGGYGNPTGGDAN